MTTTSTVQTRPNSGATELLISADSHVMESRDLWVERLPAGFRDQAPTFPPPRNDDGFRHHPGGNDPHERVREMATDGVSAEVLYPTLGLRLFGMEDARLQEACFRVYNDWLIEYCAVAPDRLVGIPAISIYDVDNAVAELTRCRNAGLKGALIWQVPHPDLPFTSDHYDKFWAAAQDLQAPVSFHILTGHNYSKKLNNMKGLEHYHYSVNVKLAETVKGLWDMIFPGILKRYPRLQIVLVEAEIGWLPFYLQQWDYFYRRFKNTDPPPIDEAPSFYFDRQCFATFFNDHVGTRCLEWWGSDNCMWSTDFPHPNSSWPHSRELVERDLSYLSPEIRAKLVRDNVARLYDMTIPEPVRGMGDGG